MISKEIIQSYKDTSYLVYDKNKIITIRIDEYNSELIDLLDRYNAERWIIITAYNPYSKKTKENKNIEKQNQLTLELKKYFSLPALGKPDNPNWASEESLFVMDIEEEKINYLAEKFKQNAIVQGDKAKSPFLKYFK